MNIGRKKKLPPTAKAVSQNCKQALAVNDKVNTTMAAMKLVFEALDIEQFCVKTSHQDLCADVVHKVVDRITGDVIKTFTDYPQGELLAKTLCDALNAGTKVNK